MKSWGLQGGEELLKGGSCGSLWLPWILLCAARTSLVPSWFGGRCPGPHHRNVYDRLIALVRACGCGEDFSVLSCGRKSFQLDARFEELREALQSLGLDGSSFYGRQRSEVEVPVRNESPELQPYTALVPDRLKIVGEGKWDCRDYLSDLSPPRMNQFDITPPPELLPDLSKVVKKDVVSLCRIWDSRGLLRIFPAELGPDHEWALAKIFNNRKNEVTDRQIGDRRGANFSEGVIPGPSRRSLPQQHCSKSALFATGNVW